MRESVCLCVYRCVQKHITSNVVETRCRAETVGVMAIPNLTALTDKSPDSVWKWLLEKNMGERPFNDEDRDPPEGFLYPPDSKLEEADFWDLNPIVGFVEDKPAAIAYGRLERERYGEYKQRLAALNRRRDSTFHETIAFYEKELAKYKDTFEKGYARYRTIDPLLGQKIKDLNVAANQKLMREEDEYLTDFRALATELSFKYRQMQK